jgi:hypothetical protein
MSAPFSSQPDALMFWHCQPVFTLTPVLYDVVSVLHITTHRPHSSIHCLVFPYHPTHQNTQTSRAQ